MCELLGPYLPTTYPNYYKKTNSANVLINDNEQLVVMRGHAKERWGLWQVGELMPCVVGGAVSQSGKTISP